MALNSLRKITQESEDLQNSVLSSFLRACAESLRIDILRVLRRDSFGVQELAFIFSMPQPGMSHHLKILTSAGLLETRREGNSIFYRRANFLETHHLFKLWQNLLLSIDELQIGKPISDRVNKIYKSRELQSKMFFEKYGKEFAERQRELCELNNYRHSLNALIDFAQLKKSSRVLEVGPGQGHFLTELASRFDRVIALDNSDKMLFLAKQEAYQFSKKIEFIHKSFEEYKSKKDFFDAIFLNMVLHHTPSPKLIFQKSKECLNEGGFLCIADLCSHKQNWVKELCGDLWLGFEPDELNEWATDVGLTEKQSVYLGLKNGFQIQLRLFQKNVSS